MFEALFAKKATHELGGGEEGAMATAPQIVKVGGQEFMAGDPNAAKAFDSWVTKAKANGEIIPVGTDGAHYPISSSSAKAELIKAELQIKHGVDPMSAQKAVDQLPGLKATAAKPFIIYKSGKAGTAEQATGDANTDASVDSAPKQAVIQKGSAKTKPTDGEPGAKPYRGPRGPVGH